MLFNRVNLCFTCASKFYLITMNKSHSNEQNRRKSGSQLPSLPTKRQVTTFRNQLPRLEVVSWRFAVLLFPSVMFSAKNRNITFRLDICIFLDYLKQRTDSLPPSRLTEFLSLLKILASHTYSNLVFFSSIVNCFIILHQLFVVFEMFSKAYWSQVEKASWNRLP